MVISTENCYAVIEYFIDSFRYDCPDGDYHGYLFCTESMNGEIYRVSTWKYNPETMVKTGEKTKLFLNRDEARKHYMKSVEKAQIAAWGKCNEVR